MNPVMETKYVRAADTAKLIRAELKAAFPTIKFSVRSHVYAGGLWVAVHYVRGPVTRRVQRIMDRFKSAWFDGMRDLKESVVHDYLNADGSVERIHYGNDYGSASREWPTQVEEYADYLACARIIAIRCILHDAQGQKAQPSVEELGTPSADKPYEWFNALHRWHFGNNDLSTLARAMAFERDWLLDTDWERAFQAAVVHDTDAREAVGA